MNMTSHPLTELPHLPRYYTHCPSPPPPRKFGRPAMSSPPAHIVDRPANPFEYRNTLWSARLFPGMLALVIVAITA